MDTLLHMLDTYHLRDIIIYIMTRTLDWLRFTYVFEKRPAPLTSVPEQVPGTGAVAALRGRSLLWPVRCRPPTPPSAPIHSEAGVAKRIARPGTRTCITRRAPHRGTETCTEVEAMASLEYRLITP
jgi:hypothetical protein